MAVRAKAPHNKSRVARLDFPSQFTVYESLVTLMCCGCSNEIKPGDYFTRRGDKAGTIRGIRYHFCLTCKPVVWSGRK